MDLLFICDDVEDDKDSEYEQTEMNTVSPNYFVPDEEIERWGCIIMKQRVKNPTILHWGVKRVDNFHRSQKYEQRCMHTAWKNPNCWAVSIYPQLLKTNTSVSLSPAEQRIFESVSLLRWRIIVETIQMDICSAKIAKKLSISAYQNLKLDLFQGSSLNTKMLALSSISKRLEHVLVKSVHQIL